MVALITLTSRAGSIQGQRLATRDDMWAVLTAAIDYNKGYGGEVHHDDTENRWRLRIFNAIEGTDQQGYIGDWAVLDSTGRVRIMIAADLAARYSGDTGISWTAPPTAQAVAGLKAKITVAVPVSPDGPFTYPRLHQTVDGVTTTAVLDSADTTGNPVWAVVKNLIEGKSYTFTVDAADSYGKTATSAVSTPIVAIA